MKGDYPKFSLSYSDEELIEHFTLSETDKTFITQVRGDANLHGATVLLKSLQYLGYFPHLNEVPVDVKSFIAKQLNLVGDPSKEYPWDTRTRFNHFEWIRQYTGFRASTAQDKEDLSIWLRQEGALSAITFSDLFECAIQRLRSLYIELPSEKELTRVVNSALTGFFSDVHQQVAKRLDAQICQKIDQLLIVDDDASFSAFEKVKAPPGPVGVESLNKEIPKLHTLRDVGISIEHLMNIPFNVQKVLFRRAKNETASEMRSHPDFIRYGLMACFISIRTMEVIDNIVEIFVSIIHRIDVRAEKKRDKELLKDIKHVEGKTQILFRVAEAIMSNPDGSIRDVIFPKVKEETFRDLVAEKKASGPQYRFLHQYFMRQKYTHHYCRMLPLVLENITFRSDNRFQPLIEALAVIKQYLGTKYKYFPIEVPLEGVVTGAWSSTVLEKVGVSTKVNRRYYELCVLQQLERALSCKEIWVEGSYEWRNPSEDLPKDWSNEQRRISYYQRLNQPTCASSFISNLRDEMTAALTDFNQVLPNNPEVSIYFPFGRSKQGIFRVATPQAVVDPPNIGLIKKAITDRYGMLELLDIFVEVDKLVDFTRFFTHSGTKEVRSREVLRPLILLSLFGEGTNIGIKRIANANTKYSYDQLLYVRKTYFSPEALRNAISAVVNKIFSLRNPQIWGEGNACASDGKRFPVWSQNLMAEWRTRYKGYGVKVYWHVETNAVSIYSQLKNHSASEAAAMIEGLIRHDTEMRVEKNFVDSHGQSEVAFAFCRLLNEFKLMPRLKRIKHERLYLPDTGMAKEFPNLAGVLTRPILWEIMNQQYDEMMKATVAMKYGDATADAILKRYSSINYQHPTYKALLELGKVEKTIFLCNYLPSQQLKGEVQAGLNVIENFNGTNDFIFYGRGGKFETNNPEAMEISMLCLHLLQNCLILINTLLLERTIEQESLNDLLSDEDFRALTPLFHVHVNPYGVFELSLEKDSFLEAA
jgi:TnpA family transposase